MRHAVLGLAIAIAGSGAPVAAQQIVSAVESEVSVSAQKDVRVGSTAGALVRTNFGGTDTRALTDFGVNRIYARSSPGYEQYASSAWLDSYTAAGPAGTSIAVSFKIAVDGLASFDSATGAGFNLNLYALRGSGWSLNGFGEGGGPDWYSPIPTGDRHERIILEQLRPDGGITQMDARDFEGLTNYGANGGEPGAFLSRNIYVASGNYYVRDTLQGSARIEERFYAARYERRINGGAPLIVPYSASPALAQGRANLDANYQMLGAAQLCAGDECEAGDYPGSELTLSFMVNAGSTFTLASWLYADDLTAGTIDFFNTAKISGVTVSAGGSLTSASGALVVLPGGGYGYPAALAPAVPEPATWALLIGGFAMIGGVMRRRRAVVASLERAVV